MFKLKPGNVFQKINKMDKKQAYTWGAIVVVCFVALLTLASFMGDADETSFDGFNTRGYDLAQMPFLNDEAEEYLLASKYPDMQNNGSTMLYSSEEKEARQEADAEAAAEAAAEAESADTDSSSDSASSSSGYGGYGGGYAGGGAAAAGPTQIGQLGSASVGRASGSGVSTSWGAPRGDFSPYKSQEKGSELPVTQLKNQDARRALAQFAQTSRAAAGFKDSKGANAKRALMGGHVQGSEAFTDGGVDLSKTSGLTLDTNAPVSSADLGNLNDAISDAANAGKQAKQDLEDDFRESMADRLLEQLWSGMINIGLQAMSNVMNQGIDALQGAISGRNAARGLDSSTSNEILSKEWGALTADQQDLYMKVTGRTADEMASFKGPLIDDYANYKKGLSGADTELVSKYSRPAEDYKVVTSEQTTDPEMLELGITEEPVVTVDQKKYAAYQKANRNWEKDMRKDFAQDLRSNRDTLLAGTTYAAQRQEVYNSAYNAHQRSGGSKISVPEYSSSNSRASSTSGNTNWWSQYGSDYGDSSKYDQNQVAACQGHAAPRTCLQNARKK